MAQETLRENKMGTMPENKLLLSMAVPMMISMLVQALYNIVDSIFVSRICEDALTAVSMAFPLQNIIISIAVGFGVGINALLSRALGQKNAERVNQVAVNGLLLALLSYLLVLVAGLVGIRAYMRAQTDIESIVEYGITYLNICVLCSFGVFCEITFERFLQATGRTIYSMVTQLVGAITNIILDPILIFGLLGFPKMGIAGAAWATVIGQCLGAVVAVILNHCKNPEIHLRLRHIRPSGKLMGEITAISIPSIIMSCISSLTCFVMDLILITFSSTAVAVFGVYFKLQSFVFMPVFGLNNGMVPIIAYNYGAQKPERIHKTIRLGMLYAVIIMALGFLGCYIHFFKAYAWGEAFLLSGCVGVALIIAMVVSSLVGTIIPMLFHKIHIDPAVASGPLITTINDLVAVVVYYGLAMIVLIDIFHLG